MSHWRNLGAVHSYSPNKNTFTWKVIWGHFPWKKTTAQDHHYLWSSLSKIWTWRPCSAAVVWVHNAVPQKCHIQYVEHRLPRPHSCGSMWNSDEVQLSSSFQCCTSSVMSQVTYSIGGLLATTAAAPSLMSSGLYLSLVKTR